MNAFTLNNTSTSSPPSASASSAAPSAKPQQRGKHRVRLDKTPADTRRRAAVVLEVMAGVRTCPQAAKDLGLSLAAYYNLEQRALEGLVQGCSPAPMGRQKRPDDQVKTLERQCKKLQQELLRYQALVRAQQRSSGLSAPPEPTKVKGKRNKKPQVRALRVVKQLQAIAPLPTTSTTVPQTPTVVVV